MFLKSQQAQKRVNVPGVWKPPVGGLNTVSSIMNTPPTDAFLLENFIAFPDRLIVRDGAQDHVTGFANDVLRLWAYSAPNGGESLWATTDAGVFNTTSAGAAPAASIALTNGKTVGAVFSTGATNYLLLVNGVDTLKQYDGTTWTSTATFGATSTATYSYIEGYRQRLFLISRSSMNLEYLPVNSVTGATTVYNMGSIFKRGGYLVALGTWTIDGGAGPDDLFVVVTSQGEIGVFSGADPATWSFKGVYYIGRPLGNLCLFKYGGDLLYLCEAGLFPLSKALQTATIDRTQGVTSKIRPNFTQAARDYFSQDGWQVIAQPDLPLLIVNIPSTLGRFQYCMHAETGSWTVFNGWSARCFARASGVTYFGTGTKVAAIGGRSDFGSNIVATSLSAFSQLGFPRNKRTTHLRPYFVSSAGFSYNLGVANEFQVDPDVLSLTISGGSASLWGSGIWGTALWTSSGETLLDWRTVPDSYGTWKALYVQISTSAAEVSFLGADARMLLGSDF